MAEVVDISMDEVPKDPNGIPYPSFVFDEDDVERWDLAVRISEAWWRVYEPDTTPDGNWRYFTPRWLFESDIETGEFEQDEDTDDEIAEAAMNVRAQELLAKLDDDEPDDDASDDEWWEYARKIADALDDVFGSPDEFGDFGEHEWIPHRHDDPMPHEVDEAMAAAIVYDAAARGARKPYDKTAHPKDRLGQWARKLGGLRRVVALHHDKVRNEMVKRQASRELKKALKASTKAGGVLRGDIRKAGGKSGPGAFAAHAEEERLRHGVSGAKRKAEAAGVIAAGTSLAAMHRAAVVSSQAGEHHRKTEITADQFGLKPGPGQDPDFEVPKHLAKISKESAKYALEHREDLAAIAKAAAKAIAARSGLHHAADEFDPDLVEASDEIMERVDYQLSLVP